MTKSCSQLAISAVVNTAPCGSNGAIIVTPSGGVAPYVFIFTLPNGTVVTNGSGQLVVHANGVYQIRVVDANECVALTSVTYQCSVVPCPTDKRKRGHGHLRVPHRRNSFEGNYFLKRIA